MSLDTSTIIVSVYVLIVAIGVVLILKLSKNKTRKISSLRLFIQAVAVIAIFMGLLIGPFNQPGSLFYPLGVSPRDRLIGGRLFRQPIPRWHIFAHIGMLLPQRANRHLRHLAVAGLRFSVLERSQRL